MATYRVDETKYIDIVIDLRILRNQVLINLGLPPYGNGVGGLAEFSEILDLRDEYGQSITDGSILHDVYSVAQSGKLLAKLEAFAGPYGKALYKAAQIALREKNKG